MSTQSEEQKSFVMVCVEKPTELAFGHGATKWRDFSIHLAGKPEIAKTSVLQFENFWLYPEEKAWHRIEQIKSAAVANRLSVRLYRIHGMPEVLE